MFKRNKNFCLFATLPVLALIFFFSPFFNSTAFATATGGDDVYYIYNGEDWDLVHIFTASAVFDTSEDMVCEILVVGGGGGSGHSNSGGGGGGGVQQKKILVPAGTYIVTIGEGGAPGLTGYKRGENGGDSSFGNLLISAGGGAGAGEANGATATTGGSGGGGNGYTNFDGAPGIDGQGHEGGNGERSGGDYYASGGGGG
ncbi:MAG: hypothetical protein GX811_08155, partial [Lentisphaerae bacterium]|nr:hypothetical protein [Lentisphaerota bacterium]